MIEPPWVKYPEYEPFDPIFNHDLEPYFHLVWRPFFEGLSPTELESYLASYPPTQSWREWIDERDDMDKLLDD